MFGEYGVYLDGKLVALVCDNSFFVKVTAATKEITQVLPQRALRRCQAEAALGCGLSLR
jgi:TfoX/Sxy family transcriptional regulator of competence genes